MLCRTCLQTQEKYHNIFEHSEEDKSISTLLFESTSIQVNHPRKILLLVHAFIGLILGASK